MNGLFGTQQQQTPSSTFRFQDLPPELQGLATKSAGFLTGQVGQPAPAYPYAIAAPLSSTQQAALPIGNALSLGDLSLAGPTAGQIGATLSGAYMPATDPAIQAIVAQINQQKQQDVQALQSQYGAIGLGNSEALARAQGQLGTEYAGTVGNVELNAYEQERQRQLQAVPFGMGTTQNALSTLFQGGALEQATTQNALTAAYQDWLRQQQGQWQATSAAAPLVERAYTPTPLTTTTAPSIFSQLTGGAAAAAEAGLFA